MANPLDICPVCLVVIRDDTPQGCELPDGQRYHLQHLPMQVRSLHAAGTRWNEAMADYDRYLDAGGRFSFAVWAERYAENYVAVAS